MVRTIASPVVAAESVIADEEKEAGAAAIKPGGGIHQSPFITKMCFALYPLFHLVAMW